MNRILVSILKIILSLVVVLVSGCIVYNMRVPASNGSKDANNPTVILSGQQLEITVNNQRKSYFTTYYCYWDDNENEKIPFEKGLFNSKATIMAPSKKGEHKLTITMKLFTTYDLYYLVE